MTSPFEAMCFAREVHAGQVREGTGNPYTDHLAEVAGITATAAYCTPIMLSVAWLHDCLEQCDVSESRLTSLFGLEITAGVMWLTDRAMDGVNDFAESCDRLLAAPGWVQTIKCADILSNTASVMLHDPAGAKDYLQKKQMQLAVLKQADSSLLKLAKHEVGKLLKSSGPATSRQEECT